LYRVEHYVDVNVRGTATLLEVLAQRRGQVRKLVIPTSMTAYGEGVYRRPAGGLLRVGIRTSDQVERWGWEPVCPETGERLEPAPTAEDAALLARNVYGLTKRYQEELALSLLGAVYEVPVVCLRLFNVYGPRQSLSNPYTGVLAIFLSRLLAGQPPVVYEDGKQTRDFVSVHDVADAVVKVTTTSAAGGQIVNVGSGVARRIADVARTLARLVGRPDLQPDITGQFRSGDIRHCTADITRAQQLLDFRPRVAWEEGLAELVSWCRRTSAFDRFAQAHDELGSRGLLTRQIAAGEPE
jgi:dTDP-L-rhamnose 4-epimerase